MSSDLPNLPTERLDALEVELDDVERQLAEPTAAADPARLRELSRRHKELSEVVGAWRDLRRARADLDTARQMSEESTGEDREAMQAEADAAEDAIENLTSRLGVLLLPKDPNDGRNVIVEIRGAEGGEEANLFARDLFDMYARYAQRRGWHVDVLSESPSERDGLNEVVFVVKGADAWARLEHEAGPHRVQRVPVTESKGRVHTSSATVTVLPEADEVEVTVDPADLKIDVYRSTGPGGQSVNTTDSAVRITHLPTGIAVAMQDERSQLQNRDKAMRVLRARIYEEERRKRQELQAATRKAQVGTGERAEKIRTYNFPQDRVTDHRVKVTVRLEDALNGNLDELTETLASEERRQALENASA